MSDDNLATRINRIFVIPSSKLQWRFRSTACICGTTRRTILALINLFAADGGVAPRGSAERKIKECDRSMRMLLEEDSSLLVADNRRFTELVLSIPNRSGTARRSRSTFAAKTGVHWQIIPRKPLDWGMAYGLYRQKGVLLLQYAT